MKKKRFTLKYPAKNEKGGNREIEEKGDDNDKKNSSEQKTNTSTTRKILK